MAIRKPGRRASYPAIKKDSYHLYNLNVACMILHLGQAIACLVIGLGDASAGRFRLPMTTLFVTFPSDAEGDVYPVQELRVRFLLPFVAVASSCSFGSAFFHACALYTFKAYMIGLKSGINRLRWIEYALTSSVMIVLVAALFGVYDILMLFLIGSLNAVTMLSGLLMEQRNQGQVGDKVDWTPFWVGSFAGAVPWIVVLVYLIPNGADIPAFVWAIFFTYFVLFNVFPFVMYCQYSGKIEYKRGEQYYMILSLVAKSLLIWLIVGGVAQPNKYT